MDEGNQVSGVYDGRLFSGVIQKTADVNGIQWIKVKLDTPLVTGRKKIKSLEVELNDQVLVSHVVRGQVAAEARERCVFKRTARAGIPEDFTRMQMFSFDMTFWDTTTVTQWIVYQWQVAQGVA